MTGPGPGAGPTDSVSSDVQSSPVSNESTTSPFCSLPAYNPVKEPNFTWGERDSESLVKALDDAYREIVHWRKNIFKIPFGNIGKSFVAELSRLYTCYAATSTLECVALKATLVLPILLLQKPCRQAKNKELAACLERRLSVWKLGDIELLVEEGRSLQQRLPAFNKNRKKSNLARNFSDLMMKGKIHAAMDLLSNQGNGGVLGLDHVVSSTETVKDVLVKKHPVGQPVSVDSVLPGSPPDLHPVVFEQIDARLIRSTALRISGAAGPSGLDAHSWRRLCTSFKATSTALCQSLADVAKRLCTQFVDPVAVAPLLSCRLIALDKCPGVRPIGIGDTARRIISKAVITFARGDIQDAAGSLQLCAGQIGGCETALHFVKECFSNVDCEAALLVDASNAFNSLNRLTALLNIRHQCPIISTLLINSYRSSSELFIDGDVLYSQEGTTQGDPLAMPLYALATLPLIKCLPKSVSQTWYADDAAATGKISKLRDWWNGICSLGPGYGYHVNADKTWLVVKPGLEDDATTLFGDTNVKVTSIGRPYLGGAIGSETYVSDFLENKVACWSKDLELLSEITASQPHAAYSAFTHGMMSKWSYLSRIFPDIGDHLQPLEDIIRNKFLPTLTGRPPLNDTDRKLVALPA